MGTKRILAPQLANVIGESPPGPLLDLFSGICAIANAVGSSRQIWCNDVQLFASSIASTLFVSPPLTLSSDQAADAAHKFYENNCTALRDRFKAHLKDEDRALQSENICQIKSLEHNSPNIATEWSLDCERAWLAKKPNIFPYRLFSLSYSGAYFGIHQCIEIDSIRYAINMLREFGEIDEDQHRWMCISLCQAMSKVSTTTGHFAQYMRINENNAKRFIKQRSRSIWREWLRAMFEISPIGSKEWRSRNRVFSQDANLLLQSLKSNGQSPAVIYADPPYTEDQYSRYYHLYETLLYYDYPSSFGNGRYRPNRFRSKYSLKTQVRSVLDSLISDCAQLGSRLILSYPEHGLVPNSKNFLVSLLRKYFGKSYSAITLEHYHSSLGGSKGREKYRVNELIYVAG